MTTSNAVASRVRRHARVRRKVSGTEQRPRLNVFRSTTHIYAQVIDDTTGRTIVAASDLDKDLASKVKGKSKTEQAVVVGTSIADKAKAQGIELVVFDRGGFKYHGRVKALADAAREAGLGF